MSAPANARLRLRFINGSQRSVLAVKLENLDVRVMAIDGQPAEPFPARNGALVLAPGSRTDVFVDAAGPAGTSFAILLHDGKQARPVGKLAISNDPPVRPRRSRRHRRCRATTCPPSSISRAPQDSS
ncbi:hypothetical protein ACQPTN_26810 [Bradyrhizobium sp. 13971]